MSNDGAMQAYALTLDKILLHAAKWHHEAAVITAAEQAGVKRIGYAQLLERAQLVSSVLADLGVHKGDRVATLAWNTQCHVEAWYGIMGMGAVCHTLNPRLTPGQLSEMLDHSAARILIVSADLMGLAQQVAERLPSIAHILVIDGNVGVETTKAAGLTIAALEPLLQQVETTVPWGEFEETAPCGLCFTSGTTGAPKGVSYTHRSSYLHTLRVLQMDVLGISSNDVVLPVVPMFHANAWGLPFSVPAVGANLVLPGRHLDGESLTRLINSQGVTLAVGVPTVWVGVADYLDATGGQLPSLKRVMVGGAAMPPALMARIEERLGVTVQTSWGMTELSPTGTCMPPGLPDRNPSISGRPTLGIDLLLTDRAGRALPQQRNVEGHLRVRGASVIERYFGHSESATDADGWFDTGDLARIDDQGYLTISGRSKDLIKSGGEWINPSEIEALVGALQQVSWAAVIGRPDAKWGERPILLVELREKQDVTDDELLEPLHGRVAPWWIPDAIVRLPKMPLASTGKIDKVRLRQDYSAI